MEHWRKIGEDNLITRAIDDIKAFSTQVLWIFSC